MSNSPKISVIVPIYNVENYLRRCLDSILAQSYTDYEVWLIDDGSKDSSPLICDEYAIRDHRIKVVHQENGGVSKARNAGLEKAQGEFIVFVDADDSLPIDVFEYECSLMEESVDMVMSSYWPINENDTLVKPVDEDEKRLFLNREEALVMMYKPIWVKYQGYLWNKIYRREIIERHHLRFDEKIFFNEDRLFVTQYLCRIKGLVVYSNHVVYHYYLRSGSAMSSLKSGYNLKFITDIHGYAGMRKAILSIKPSQELKLLARKGILSSYTNIFRTLTKGGYPPRQARIKLMWEYVKILGPFRVFVDIIVPHFARHSKM